MRGLAPGAEDHSEHRRSRQRPPQGRPGADLAEDRRVEVLARVAAAIAFIARADAITFIGIDGVDGAGKSTFGDELSALPEAAGRRVIRASVDSFHGPRAERYARGRTSPEGFYRDSYDYAALRRELLEPLRGGKAFRRKFFDVASDSRVDAASEHADPSSILVFDGIFLHRPELRSCWDFSIWLEVPWEKNHHLAKHPEWAANWRRYADGQRIYVGECDPASAASMVIDNSDLAHPLVIRGPA